LNGALAAPQAAERAKEKLLSGAELSEESAAAADAEEEHAVAAHVTATLAERVPAEVAEFVAIESQILLEDHEVSTAQACARKY